jgi:hypothetical protein
MTNDKGTNDKGMTNPECQISTAPKSDSDVKERVQNTSVFVLTAGKSVSVLAGRPPAFAQLAAF